jgi:hypothetical protein
MKNIILLFLFIALVLNIQAQNDTVNLVWETDTMLTTVESVLYSKTENILYASCINGKPTNKDNNGFIAKITLDGEIKELKWITGLNAPKGMGIFENYLYVTDIDRLVVINIAEKKIVKEIKIENAQFLNDIAISNSGIVFISDMYTNTIHSYFESKLETFIQSKELNYPNGLFCENKILFIGTRNAIVKAEIETKDFEIIVENTGSIDGLKKVSENKFLISDWKSKVHLVSLENKNLLLNTANEGFNAADFEYIPELNQLFIPTFFHNKVMCYELK